VKSAQVLCLEDTTLSTLIKVEIKHAMARRKISLVLEIIQGKATVAEASRACNLRSSEFEEWSGAESACPKTKLQSPMGEDEK
jgi:hypothetical protein